MAPGGAFPFLLFQGHFIPAAMVSFGFYFVFFPTFPAHVGLSRAPCGSGDALLPYLLFLCVDYLQLLNCLKEPSFSC